MTEVQAPLTPSLDIYALSRHLKNRKVEHVCDRDFITIQCLNCGTNHPVATGSKDRTCPACSKEIYGRMFEKYEAVVKSKKELKFLTLTWRPVKEQSAGLVREIGAAVIKLLHRKKYAKVWKGVLAVLECKKTKSGLFYYHVHCILEGKYIPQKEISDDWREISGFSIVYIKRIWRTPTRAFRYVLKYLLKGFNLFSKGDREDFKDSMRGVRYVRSYGSFYNFQYRTGEHVYFPCPGCGSIKCWVVIDFLTESIPLGVPYPNVDLT